MNSLAGNRVVLWRAPQEDLNALGKSLARRGFLVLAVDSPEQLRSVIRGQDVDLIVARLCRCFERPLLELLRWLQKVPAAPQVLIVADAMDVDLYLEAMRRGAFDCVGLPLNENELERIVSQALETRHLQAAAGGRE